MFMSARHAWVGVGLWLAMDLCVANRVVGADWPGWRGPGADGISVEKGWKPEAIAAGKSAWKKLVGVGWSAVSVVGDRLYTAGNANNKDSVYCLNAGTGAELWVYKYDCEAGDHSGPRATPVVDGNAVYMQSREGHLLRLSADKGEAVWRINVSQSLGCKPPKWGYSASVRVAGDRLLVNAGERGAALKKDTGEIVWKSAGGIGGYSTPVVVGERVLVFGEKDVYSVQMETGKLLWKFPWVTSYDVNATDPVSVDGKVFVTSGYGRGCALLDVSGEEPKAVWNNKAISSHFGNCVYFDGHLYGVDGNGGNASSSLKCVDPLTGSEKWAQKLGFGSILLADGKLLFLGEDGTLRISIAAPDGYKEVAKVKLLSGKCWTLPVLAGGMLYCRSHEGELVCIDARGE